MFKRSNLAALLGALAAAAAFAVPAASHAGEFERQLSITDGFSAADYDRLHSGVSAPVKPASPAQLAQIAFLDRERSVTDGFSAAEWDKRQSPELQELMAKMKNNPMMEALSAFYERQRRLSDGG